MQTFGTLDYIALCMMLAVSLAIGLHQVLKKYYTRFFKTKLKIVTKTKVQDTLENEQVNQNEENNKSPVKSEIGEYLTANASMSILPITLSLLATFFSATGLLGNPAEVYQYGIQYWMHVFGWAVTPILGAYITGPMFSRLKVTSVFEYFQKRFNSELVALLGVFCYLIRSIISSALFIYGPATTLNLLASISPNVAITIVGVIGTFYTSIGGMLI